MFNKIAVAIDYAVRLSSIALLFIINPLAAVLINMFFDAIDGTIYIYLLKIKDADYQLNDKFLDYVYYIGLIAAAIYWNLPDLWLLGILFFYRSIGQIIFFLKRNRKIFVYFPNFFEIVVFGLLITDQIKEWFSLDTTLPLLVLFIVFKIWYEIFTHGQGRSIVRIFWIPLLKKLSIL